MKNKDDPTVGDKLGIKGLNKSKRRKLEAYQHLFYLLQVKQKSVLLCLIFHNLTYSLHPLNFKLFSVLGQLQKHTYSNPTLSLVPPLRPIHPTWPS